MVNLKQILKCVESFKFVFLFDSNLFEIWAWFLFHFYFLFFQTLIASRHFACAGVYLGIAYLTDQAAGNNYGTFPMQFLVPTV